MNNSILSIGFPSDAPPAGGGMLVVVAVGGVELETANPSIPGRCVYQYNPGQQVPATFTWSHLQRVRLHSNWRRSTCTVKVTVFVNGSFEFSLLNVF